MVSVFSFFFFHFCLFPAYSEVNSDTFWRVLRYRFYGTYSLPCPINAGIKAANSRYRRILLKFSLSLKDILALTKKGKRFLVCKHVTRRLCWWSVQQNFFLKNLHENRVMFPEERNAFVLDHQDSRRDVTCKPTTEEGKGKGEDKE